MFGIDYGAKMAGTTVVAYLSEMDGSLTFAAAAKKQDADAFLLDFFASRPSSHIFLDAPLSLPSVYATRPMVADGDFFYRACDKALGAMSPMFLGGLTARAMALAEKLRASGHLVSETYPGALARALDLKNHGYKKEAANIPGCATALAEKLGALGEGPHIPDWHHFDALLALHSGLRASKNEAQILGNPNEGLIIF